MTRAAVPITGSQYLVDRSHLQRFPEQYATWDTRGAVAETVWGALCVVIRCISPWLARDGNKLSTLPQDRNDKEKKYNTTTMKMRKKKKKENVEHKWNYGLTYSLPPFLYYFFLSRTNAKSNIVVVVLSLNGFQSTSFLLFCCVWYSVCVLFPFLWIHSVPIALTKAQSILHNPGV